MIRILLITTLVWGCSLLVYELLLKRTSFHRLNRCYMLLTFLAGIALPLLPWGRAITVRDLSGEQEPGAVAGAHAAVARAQAGLEPAATAASDINWWLLLYLCGAAISLLFLVRELWQIRRLYRNSAIHRSDSWIIAETGADHSPFSLLHIIFVGDRLSYTPAQWKMVLSHEQQHFRSRHFLDLAFVQLAAILLWFHPLVYIYRSRLRLIHEFEVDSLQSGDVRSYGRFLLEQAACRPLAMTHSFNFSPLKHRIRMMTKPTDGSWAKARFLLLVPMLSCFVWACTKTRPHVEVDIKDRTVSRRDVALSFPESSPADTVIMINPETGKNDTVMMTIFPRPSALDNQPILTRAELGLTPHCINPGETFGMAYLLKQTQLEPTLAKMTDGEYYMGISDLIIDKNGRVVYYMMTLPENHSNMKSDPSGLNFAQPNGLTQADEATIQRKISEVLIAGDVDFTVVKDKSSNPAPYYLDEEYKNPAYKLSASFMVKDHKVTFQ